jgi:rhodanese-related sulfurtransferase
VQWITTQQLADWIADHNRPQPILLDVRTRAEWKVSHLPRARLVLPDTDPTPAIALLPKNASIVTYCAIGYRSARAARQLRAAGYTDVRNLEGSIFQWANEHRTADPRRETGDASSSLQRVLGAIAAAGSARAFAVTNDWPNDGC